MHLKNQNTEADSRLRFEPGHFLPDVILTDPHLSNKAKLLAAVMITHQAADSKPTNKYYSQKLDCTERTIVRLRSELKEQGYIGNPDRDKSVSHKLLLRNNKTSNIIYPNNFNYSNGSTEGKTNKLFRPDGPIRFKSQPKTSTTRMSHKDPTLNLPRKAKKIMQLWLDRNLRKTDFTNPTQVTVDTIHKINLLLAGKLYGNGNSPGVLNEDSYKGRLFTIPEITQAMDRFELAVNDKYHHIKNKTQISGISLGDFLYSPYGNNKTKCYFLWFLENEPVAFFNKDIDSQSMYDWMVKAYLKFKGLDTDHKLNTGDISNLIHISNRLNRYVRVNKKSLPHKMARYEYQACMFLINCALELNKGDKTKVTPYSMRPDWVFEALPDYVSRHRLMVFN